MKVLGFVQNIPTLFVASDQWLCPHLGDQVAAFQQCQTHTLQQLREVRSMRGKGVVKVQTAKTRPVCVLYVLQSFNMKNDLNYYYCYMYMYM